MADLPKPPPVPCGSCPYRRDVPSGVWDAEEYAKLPRYDGTTGDQFIAGAVGLFMCHQRDGCICGGWLLTHDPRHLAALRMNRVDPSAFDYPDSAAARVEVWASGAEAAAHGLRDLDAPSAAAQRKIDGLVRQRVGTNGRTRP